MGDQGSYGGSGVNGTRAVLGEEHTDRTALWCTLELQKHCYFTWCTRFELILIF